MVIHHVTHEALESFHEILAARSPVGFTADRLPVAMNCPVLGNEERHCVSLLYKQDSFAARCICPEGITLNTSSIERLGEALAKEALWI